MIKARKIFEPQLLKKKPDPKSNDTICHVSPLLFEAGELVQFTPWGVDLPILLTPCMTK
jgi:hypothetical protein